MEGDEFSINLSWLKKARWNYVFLALFLILGIYLRSYHLDFPTIGYHNMKENELLDQAVFFMDEGNFLHKQAYAFAGFDETTNYHEEYGQAPLVPYMVFILWKIFGYSLWMPRLLMILFFMAAVFVTYLIARKLTKNEYISVLAAGLMTIMPLGIYFGRNIQVEPPALFFAMLGIYYYLKWTNSLSKKELFYTALFLGIAGLFKYTFLILVVPMLFIFPFRKFYEKFKNSRKEWIQDIKYAIYGLLPLIIGVIVYEFLTITSKTQRNYDFELFRIFTSAYWEPRSAIVMSFLRDNFTIWFVYIALIGLLFVLFKYRTKFGRFLIGYAVSIIFYIAAMSSKIAGHSYYQMPFLPLVCILIAYALFSAGAILKQVLNINYAFYLPLIVILLIAPSSIAGNDSMQAANDRVFGTVFYGQDFLGEYLKTRMLPNERFAFATHAQDLATCSYAKHRCGAAGDIETFKHKEEVFNIHYVYVGVAQLNTLIASDDPMWTYIRENYKIDLVGLMPANNQLVPMHIILKKGGKFNLSEVQGKQAQLGRTYDSKRGQVSYYYIQNS